MGGFALGRTCTKHHGFTISMRQCAKHTSISTKQQNVSQVHPYCPNTTKCIHTLHHGHFHFNTLQYSYSLLHVVHPCCFSALFLSSKHSGVSFSTLLSCNILHILLSTSYTSLHKALTHVSHKHIIHLVLYIVYIILFVHVSLVTYYTFYFVYHHTFPHVSHKIHHTCTTVHCL